MDKKLSIRVFQERLAICRLDKEDKIPDWAKSDFLSITRTFDELSIVCSEENIPENVICEKEWRFFMIDGILDFSLVGILSSISRLLARQGISIFAVSTYNTDYILVKDKNLSKGIEALKKEGYIVKFE